MINGLKITGLGKVRANLRMYARNQGDAFARGLVKGGALIKAVSQKKYCPVQTGNLRGSAFLRRFGTGWKSFVIVGYTAEYAAVVHENPNAAHGKAFNVKHAAEITHAADAGLKASTAEGGMFNRGEEQQYKYLERPARELRDEVLAIIFNEGKKGLVL